MPAKKQAAHKSLKDLVPTIQKYKSKLSEDAKLIVKSELKNLFDNHPEVEGVRWCQCTPLGDNEVDDMKPEDFRIEEVEYKLNSHVSFRASRYHDSALTDSGFDRQSDDWVSPWNDRRIANPILLDNLTVLEERLFDAQDSLAMAFGDSARITVTRKEVVVEDHPTTGEI